MSKFNKQRYWDLRGLLRDFEKDIFQARINIWETLWAIRAASATEDKKKIKDLTDVLKIERVYLVDLLEKRRIFESEIEKEIKKGGIK